VRITDTSFLHRSDMTVNERLKYAEIQLDKAVERESVRAMTAASMDEMIDEIIDELREIAYLKTCNPIIRRRLMAMVLRGEKDLKKIAGGEEYVRRRRREDD
jgi:hypothetical protein